MNMIFCFFWLKPQSIKQKSITAINGSAIEEKEIIIAPPLVTELSRSMTVDSRKIVEIRICYLLVNLIIKKLIETATNGIIAIFIIV